MCVCFYGKVSCEYVNTSIFYIEGELGYFIDLRSGSYLTFSCLCVCVCVYIYLES